MKTALRILSHAGSVKRSLPLYLVTTALAVLLGLVNLSLLVPLLEVIFSSKDTYDTLVSTIPQPNFSINPRCLKYLFNYHLIHIITVHGRTVALYFICFIMISAVLLASLFKYLAETISARLRANAVHNLRKRLFDKVLSLHTGYLAGQNARETTARLTGDMQEVEHAMSYFLTAFLKDPFAIISSFIMLFCISPQLAWVALIALPAVGGVITKMIMRHLFKQATQSQISLGRLTNILEECVECSRKARAIGGFFHIRGRFSQENEAYRKLTFLLARNKILLPLLSEFLGVLVMALLLTYGGRLILLNESSVFTASRFITFLVIFSQSLVPIKSFFRSLGNIQRGLAAGERVLALLDTTPESNK